MKLQSNKGISQENKPGLYQFLRLDLSLFLLIISNIITIILATTQNWNLVSIMWIFWVQSIIIGIFNFIRILTLKEFSTENFKVNDQPVEPTESTKKFTAFFFLFHYGFFHLVYMLFLLSNNAELNGIPVTYNLSLNLSGIIGIIIMGMIFFGNHLFSFIYNYERDSKKVRNIGTIMFFPYARILPMHLAIVFGLFLINDARSIIIFLILKTIADIVMHQVEHHI
jgi:hypothetical protein